MNHQLIYPQNSSFRILVLADIQESSPLSSEYGNKLLDLIKQTNPQLIVLLGDMIFGPVLFTKKKVKNVILSIVDLLNKAQIPFTFVFGNHDLDSLLSSEKQTELYRSSEYCITPAFNDRECSQSYSLDVLSSDNDKLFSLLFFDSGATCITGYGISYKGPNDTTLEWTKSYLEDSSVPCFAFQHVPVFNIYKLLDSHDRPVQNSVKGHGMFRGKWFTLNENAEGVLGESPCPEWQKEDKQFASWCLSDNMKAAVFGHDHKNSFSGVLNGIHLLQTPCVGTHCYGNDDTRGARIIDINTDGSFTSRIFALNQRGNN